MEHEGTKGSGGREKPLHLSCPSWSFACFVFLHGDHLGSTSLTTCGSPDGCGETPYGSVVARQLYHPYGEIRYSAVSGESQKLPSSPPGLPGTLPTDFGFTGQRHDGTGLIFMHARYYHPALGRFASADTVVPSPSNPQDWNRYTYVGNNPVLYRDPSGHRRDPGGDELPPILPEPPAGVDNEMVRSAADVAPASDTSSSVLGRLLAPADSPNNLTGNRALDFLVEPWLHLVPRIRAEGGKLGVKTMMFDAEIEVGISNGAKFDTGNPIEISPQAQATRVYNTCGPLAGWFTEVAPGQLKLFASNQPQELRAGGIGVKTTQRAGLMIDVGSRPGAIRKGIGLETPVAAQIGTFSVQAKPYIRISHNGYYDRSGALLAEVAGAYVLVAAWEIVVSAGALELSRVTP